MGFFGRTSNRAVAQANRKTTYQVMQEINEYAKSQGRPKKTIMSVYPNSNMIYFGANESCNIETLEFYIQNGYFYVSNISVIREICDRFDRFRVKGR